MKPRQDRPSTAAQNREIRSMGGDPDDLSYSEAKDLIDDLAREQEEKEIEWMILDNMLNDKDVHEICGYEHLSETQLNLNRAFLTEYDQMVKRKDVQLTKPDWPEQLAAQCSR